MNIAIAQVRPNDVALRQVNRESETFLGIVESVRSRGIINPISVRERTEDEGEEQITYYELVDGLHRYTAAMEAGLEEVPVHVVNLKDDEVLEAQIIANIHKQETRPIEYTNQLKRILSRNPLMTASELAVKLGKSVQWIQQRLSLSNINNAEIQSLIDEGKIVLANAYALAKLPEDEHANFISNAMTDPPSEFIPLAQARGKEIKEANRQGKDKKPATFEPQAHAQKVKVVKEEFENSQVGPDLISKAGASTAQEGWNLAVSWFLHLDADSVAAQKEKWDAKQKSLAETKVERAAKRKAVKAEKAKKKAEEAEAAAKAAAEAVGAQS